MPGFVENVENSAEARADCVDRAVLLGFATESGRRNVLYWVAYSDGEKKLDAAGPSSRWRARFLIWRAVAAK